MRFYAVSNYTYGIDVSSVGSNALPVVDVYRELLGGGIVPVQTNIAQSKQGPIGTANDFDLSNPPAGKYLVRVRNQDPEAFGNNTDYTLKVTSSTPAGTTLAIVAADLVSNGDPPPGAVGLYRWQHQCALGLRCLQYGHGADDYAGASHR